LPRKFTEDSIKRLCGPANYAYDLDSATSAILTPTWDILDRGGKRWRPVLVMLIAEALGGEKEKVLPCAYLCELVHNGSLAVDDIEDDSKLRRGKPCLHLIYGNDIAINVGNAMYFMPLVVFKDFKAKGVPEKTILKAYELYSQEMINLHFGQGLDIWWHQGKKNPNVQEYLQMCAYKTGTLARLSVRLSALLSGASDDQIEKIGRFAEAIGVAFQIQDDLLNITGDNLGKGGSGEDIHEGKRSLMVIHSLDHAKKEKRDRLEEILKMKTEDVGLIKEAINIMKETDSLTFAHNEAKKIVLKAWDLVKDVIPDCEAKNKLKIFADFLIERSL